MKIEVGQFIRTNDGIIAKILNIKDGYAWCDNVLEKIPDEGYNFYENDYFNIDNEVDLGKIKKASYNIIDLIEVGDYVNGSEVLDFENKVVKNDDKFIPFAVITENCYLENTDSWIIEKDIKSIVTHEQMEQMAYKVGE